MTGLQEIQNGSKWAKGRWGEGNPAVDNVLKPGLLDLIPRVCRGRSVTLSGTHETDHRPLVATAPAWHSPVPLRSGFHRALRELRGRQQDQKALEKTCSPAVGRGNTEVEAQHCKCGVDRGPPAPVGTLVVFFGGGGSPAPFHIVTLPVMSLP